MSQHTTVAITREGWYYLGMFGFIVAGAIIRDINLLYIMAGMMLGPLLYSLYASTKSLRRIRVSRQFPSMVGVGYPLYVEVTAAKPKGSATAFSTMISDRIRRQSDRRDRGVEARLFFPTVPLGGQATASWQTRLNRRGRYVLGPMRASTSMPLGLVRASTDCAENAYVLVSPRLGLLSPAWSRYLELRNDGGQKSARRRGNAEGDFYGMREWRDGDSRNWIHWRTSAKRNKLTVRQFEQRINQDLVVVLDLWQPVRTTVPNERLEQAISFVATLVVDYGRQGSTHLVVTTSSDSPFAMEGVSSPVFRNELMERLAIVEPTVVDTLPTVLAEALSKASPKSKVVLVTSRDIDLHDTEAFDVVWKRPDIRRTLSDVVVVNTEGAHFEEWFRLEEPSTTPESAADAIRQENGSSASSLEGSAVAEGSTP